MELKFRKKMKIWAVTSMLLLSQVVSPVSTFQKQAYAADVIGGYWADEYLNNLVKREIMRGDQLGNLNPNTAVTRAEFVSMVNRALGYTQKGTTTFRDVKGTEWYADDISIAAEQGYFSGNGRGSAGPKDYLTREEAVAMFCRTLKVEGISGEKFNFKDSRTFNTWSRDYINASANKKYVVGYEDNTFRPTNKITRGEAAKIISDVIGENIATSGEKSFGFVNGNVTIGASGVTLSDTVISGDLYITEGVGLGYTQLNNVTVQGEVIVSGAGESNVGKSSITLTNCSVEKLTIDNDKDKTLTLRTDGSTLVKNTVVKTNAYLEEVTDNEGGFETVTLNGEEETSLNLSGSFGTVNIMSPKSIVVLGKGTINSLQVDEEAVDTKITLEKNTLVREAYLDTGVTIEGEGEIEKVVINAPDTKIEGLPNEIIIRPGITANIDGKKMTSSDAEMYSSSPRIQSRYPKVESIEATAATALLKTNKSGDLYWVLTLASEDNPSASEIVKPKKSEVIKSGTVKIKADEELEIKLSGMKSNEKYLVSAVLVDEKDDRSSKKSEKFTTVDNIVPAFVSGYPKLEEVTNVSASVATIPTKNCNFYWAVYNPNSVAPTVKNLVDQKTDGAVKKGIDKSGKLNIESNIVVDGLEEAKAYDLYLVASDGKTNTSAMTKMSFTTKDKTAPKFITGYPKPDKTTETSVDVKYSLDKDCTVYYVVVPRDDLFPTPIPPSLVPPELQSDLTKQAIINGTSSFKSGKATAKKSVEGKLTISGLAKETPYDAYFVAQDKDGNISEVVKLAIKTTDKIIPTAKLEFDDHIDGNPMVETDMRIVFSEIVCDALTGKNLVDIPKADLINNISLYDLSQTKRTLINLNYEMIKVEDIGGKTIVTLSKDVTMLNSGNSYEYELNKIMDTSGNRMSERTLLPKFKTVAPLVEMEKTVASKPYDITFKMNPQAVNTAPGVLYDVILETNATVRFELYERIGEGPFIPSVGYDENGAAKASYIEKDKPLTVRYLIDMQNKTEEENPEYTFAQFNTFTEPKEYAIRFIEINGNNVRAGWSETVDVGVKCVIGSAVNLSAIAANVKGNLDNVVNNEGAALVHYPNNFKSSVSFTDTIVPQFIDTYPQFIPGDTKINILAGTNKAADFHYLIAPVGTISTTPSALDIMNGNIKPSGGYSGKFIINSAGIIESFWIEKLIPKQAYDIYYVLKGNPPEPSQVFKATVTTVEVKKPIIDELRTNVYKKYEKAMDMITKVDSESTIYWIVYQKGDYVQPDKPKPNEIKDIVENSTGLKPIASGMKKTKANEDVIINVTGLETELYYDFFVTAQKDLGGEAADVVAVWGIKPQDSTPPKVKSSNTNVWPGSVKGSLNGELVIEFTEPLYFSKTDGGRIEKVTDTEFRTNYTSYIVPGDVTSPGAMVLTTRGELGEVDGSGKPIEGAISYIQFQYRQASNGSTISYTYDIYDKSGNLAGKLNIVFKEKANEDGTAGGEWVVDFKLQKGPVSRALAKPSELMARSVPEPVEKPVVQTPVSPPVVEKPTVQAPPTVVEKPVIPTPPNPPVVEKPVTPTIPVEEEKPQLDVEVTTIIEEEKAGYKGATIYGGQVILDFTQPIYYLNAKNKEPQPLTVDIFKQKLGLSKLSGINVTSPVKGTPGSVESIDMDFKGASKGSIISVGIDICDSVGNVLGKLSLQFDEDSAEWETVVK